MFAKQVKLISDLIEKENDSVIFNMLEIGARRVGDDEEPFHSLVDCFPGSRVIGFEIGDESCNELNSSTGQGFEYYPFALGRKEETRIFYETMHPMCSSLYKPNQNLIGLYNNMDVAGLKTESTIETISLDDFASKNNIGNIDFIKIDIQGAELDVFQGAVGTLKSTLAIVTEVEFVPVYLGQPLFGEVSSFLTENGFSFHKFLGLSGRTLKPVLMNNNPNYATQHMWSDAVFVNDIASIGSIDSAGLLKLGVLMFLYGSPDITMVCFQVYDSRHGSCLSQGFVRFLRGN